MKFFPLLMSNLGRHKLRTALTTLSVAMALFLFASLRTVVTTLAANARFGGADRLIALNATGLVFTLPVSYAERIRAINGVNSVTWANWFGGRYGDGKRFFANFAVDGKGYLDMYPEMFVEPAERERWLADRGGALVGPRLLDVFGWKVGQNVTLQGTIFPGDWTFTIDGVYHPKDKSIADDALMFQYALLDEKMGRAGQVGWYIVKVGDPSNAPTVGKAIDDLFRNSSVPTKTGTEKAFNASFANMWGNVSLLMNTIGMAVVFAILLVTANAMMMTTRERTREVAVLKTIGFSDRRLFTLVMLEAGIVTLVGAFLGLGFAKLLYRATNFNAMGFLPGFDVSNPTLAVGGLIALFLMVASGLAPAWRAAQLPVVQALRNVG